MRINFYTQVLCFQKNTIRILSYLLLSAFLQKATAQTYNMAPGTIYLTCAGSVTFCDPSISSGTGGLSGCVGSSNFNYQNSLNITETFSTSTGQYLTINMQAAPVSFQICSSDTLKIYDGASTSSTLLYSITNTTSPPGTFSSTTPSITFQFISDVSGNSKGWQASISCFTPVSPSNNEATGAINVTPGNPCSSISGNTQFGTQSAAPSVCTGTDNADVWYSFTANTTAPTITVTPTTLTMRPAAQFCGGTAAAPTSWASGVACNSAAAAGGTVTLTPTGLTVGTVYRVRVWDYLGSASGASNQFSICVTGGSQQDCAGALTVNSYFQLSGTASGVGSQEYNSSTFGCLVSGEHNSLWFKMHVSSPGTIAFTLTPANSGSQDIDWAIWGPYTSSSCSNITGSPVRCTYAVQHPTNGLGDPTYVPAWGGISYDYTESAGGNGWLAWIPCTSGSCSPYESSMVIDNTKWFIFLLDGFSSFSGGNFSLTWTGTAQLPIVLTNFYGLSLLDKNALYWATQAEVGNDHWTIERSADGESYETIAELPGAGNSTSTKFYQYDDKSPLIGNNYYRLKQTDYDGKFTYSNVVLLSNFEEDITVKNIYPNPTNDELYLDLYSNEDYNCSFRIINSLGREAMNFDRELVQGANLVNMDLRNFDKGVYFLQVFNPKGSNILTKKIVKM